jgi:hypothetical protein
LEEREREGLEGEIYEKVEKSFTFLGRVFYFIE